MTQVQDEFTEYLVKLAVQSSSVRLQALLVPHKLALFALENSAAASIRERVLSASSMLDKWRAAKLELRSVWLVSSRLARTHAAREFELLGLEMPTERLPTSTFVNRLSVDLNRALRSPVLTDEVKAQRAAIACVSAANRSYTDTQLMLYAAAAEANPGMTVEKVWVTNFDAKTPPCADCSHLNGTVMLHSTEFAYTGTVYSDLQGPPRHPYCRCRLVVRVGRRS